MHKSLATIIAFSVVFATAFPASAASSDAGFGLDFFSENAVDYSLLPEGEYLPGQVVVELTNPNISLEQAEKRVFSQVALGFNVVDMSVVSTSHIRKQRGQRVVLEYDPTEGSIQDVVAKIADKPYVRAASPNVFFHATQTSDDPSFELKDDLFNTGANVGRSGGSFDADVDVELAWSIDTGSNSVIAVIDSGVDTDHPDIATNLWTNDDETVNGLDSDANGYIDDVNGWDFVSFDYPGTGGTTPRDGGDTNLDDDNDPNPEPNGDNEDGSGSADGGATHGTHVAGIAAAVGGNATGVVGVAPDAKIMPLRALDDEGNGLLSQIQDAVDYAIDNGANVINMSLSTDGGSAGSAYTSTFDTSMQDAWDNDVLVVASAGNRNKNLSTYPESPVSNDGCVDEFTNNCTNNWVVGVGATSNSDEKSSYSNYATTGHHIDVSAPGGEAATNRYIYSTEYQNLSYACCSDLYGYKAGTSMAAPQVAGAVAILRSYKPDMDVETARDRVIDNTDKIGLSNMGSGRLNAVHMLTGKATRLNGATRYDTAVQASQLSFPEDGTASAVVIASGVSFPGGLTSSGLAGNKVAPLLLTDGTTLTAATLAEVQRALGDTAKTIYIAGGTDAISSDIETELSGVGYSTVTRLSGADRIETATLIATQMHSGDTDEVIIVNKDNFAGGVAAAAVAADKDIPILVNQDNWLHNTNRDWLVTHSVSKVYLVGGTTVLSNTVKSLIEGYGISVVRISGADRYEASANLAYCFYSTTAYSPCNGFTTGRTKPTQIGLAPGTGFAAALSGGPYVGKQSGPVLLTKNNDVPTAVVSYVSGITTEVYDGYIFGGTSVVNTAAESEFKSAL